MGENQCQFCNKYFSTSSNLLKHYRNVHKVEKEPDLSEKKCECNVCGKGFSSQSTLNRHKATQHESGHCDLCNKTFETKKELYKHTRTFHDDHTPDTNEGTNKNSKKIVICDMCSERFASTSSLNRHKRNKHGEVPTTNDAGNLKCPECGSYFHSCNELDKHLEIIHQVTLQQQTKYFKNMTDFKQWKKEMEQAKCAYFFLRNRRDNVLYYRCNRSGKSRRKEGLRVRQRMNWAPAMKTGHACPARMIVRKTESGCKVEYQEVHVGHQLSSQFLRLTKGERSELAGKLKMKTTMNAIIDDTMDNVKDLKSGVSEMNKRGKLKSVLDSIYAMSKDVDDKDIDAILKSAEHLMTQTRNFTSSSPPREYHDTSDISADTTKSPAYKKFNLKHFMVCRQTLI